MDLTILYHLYRGAYGVPPTVEYQQWFLDQSLERQDLEMKHLQAAANMTKERDNHDV